jgi:hypothetical protein
MISAIIYITVGTFMGWNLPQPTWAKNIQDRLMSKIRKPK